MGRETMQLLYVDAYSGYQEEPAVLKEVGSWVSKFNVIRTGRVLGIIFRSPEYGIHRFVPINTFTEMVRDGSVEVTYKMSFDFKED